MGSRGPAGRRADARTARPRVELPL
jgi:hypothetical protein